MKRRGGFQPVCAAAGLAPGDARRCELAGREILVCNVAGQLHAVSARCSHAAWALGGDDLAGFRLTCSLHGACFDVRDGSVVAGPAAKPLDRYPVRVREGWIEVRIRGEEPVAEGAFDDAECNAGSETGGPGAGRVP